MKYFHWFKGFIFIALACSVNAQGSTFFYIGSENYYQKEEPAAGYTISVSAGKVQNSQAAANLTMSGENSKVSVEKKGTVTLVAGKSIVLHPGTKISNGGFLYASIEPRTKLGKHQNKEVSLVTIEEKMRIEEQVSLGIAFNLFKPFPSSRRGHLHAGDAENGSFRTYKNELTGVTPEQQKKVAVESHLLPEFSRQQMNVNFNLLSYTYVYRPETVKVLRL